MKNFSVKKIVELVNQSGILQNKIAESDLLAPDVLIEIYSKLARLLSQNCIDKYEDANVCFSQNHHLQTTTTTLT